MKKGNFSIAASVCAAAITITGAAFADKADDTVRVGFKSELQNMDSYFNTSRVGIIVARHVWDNLLYRDPSDFSYKPALASSYKWVDDVTLEFELRQGVTFHNGEPFDADDVVYTLNFVSDPENMVKNQNVANWIANAEKISQFKVRINLKKPFPAALDFIAGPLPIYPNEYYAQVGPEGMNSHPIGTGPYMVSTVEPGKVIKFVKNDDYYEESPKGQPSIANLEWHTVPDANTSLALLMTGGLDWMWKVTPDQGEMLGNNPDITVKGGATMRIGYLQMDAAGRSGDHPLKDVRVRRAISYAINRDAIVEHLLPEGANVVHSACFPRQFGCTTDVPRYDYNPEKARELLAEAGFGDGFQVTFDAYSQRQVVETMQGNLRAVGIDAELQFNKYTTTRDNVRAGKSTMNFMTWGSYSINDASAIIPHFFTGGPDDLARDEEVKNWIEVAGNSSDKAVRIENYTNALSKIAGDAYWLPLWNYAYLYGYNKDLNFTPSADELPRFFNVSWN